MCVCVTLWSNYAQYGSNDHLIQSDTATGGCSAQRVRRDFDFSFVNVGRSVHVKFNFPSPARTLWRGDIVAAELRAGAAGNRRSATAALTPNHKMYPNVSSKRSECIFGNFYIVHDFTLFNISKNLNQ